MRTEGEEILGSGTSGEDVRQCDRAARNHPEDGRGYTKEFKSGEI